MPVPDSAFRHHPDLKGLIADPETSWFRTFQPAELVDRIREAGGDPGFVRDTESREALRGEALSRRPDPDLWVFAYGSLMWDPAFLFDEVRRAHAPHHARSFCLWDENARGSREAPGLMAGLDRGTGCTGYAFHIPAERIDTETEVLCRRELIAGGYLAEYIPLETAQGPVTALAFVADHACDDIRGDLDIDTQAAMIACAEGMIGTARAYLENVVRHLDAMGIRDAYVERLWAKVQARAPGSGG